MALFGKKGNEGKEAKATEIMEKYGVSDIKDPDTYAKVLKLAEGMKGFDFLIAGNALHNNVAQTNLGILTILSRIMEQNFIMISQMDKLIETMSK